MTTPAANVQAIHCLSYDNLLNGQFGGSLTELDIINVAKTKGRIHVQARPGAGKTRLLRSIASQANNLATTYIHVPSLPQRTAANSFETFNFEFQAALHSLTEQVSQGQDARLMLIDGLDELSVPVGAAILDLCDSFAAESPANCVIVADDMRRRNVRYDRWMLLTISSPPLAFWAESHRPSISSVCFDKLTSLGISSEELDGILSPDVDRSKELGTIRSVNEAGPQEQVEMRSVVLEHILVRDLIRSRQLFVDRGAAWKKDYFDAVSLQGSHFEPFALAAETANSNDADALVRALYDWNFYAATYVLRVTPGYKSASTVTPPLATALLAMVAERQWDVLRVTGVAAHDELRIIGHPVSDRFLGLKNQDELMDVIDRLDLQSAWFTDWKRVFVRQGSDSAEDDDFITLQNSDAILAWTVSNTLKRCKLTDSQLQFTCHLLSTADDSVRWRAAHVLGSECSWASISALASAAANDSYRWVRRTAARSLIEIAARADGDVSLEVGDALLV